MSNPNSPSRQILNIVHEQSEKFFNVATQIFDTEADQIDKAISLLSDEQSRNIYQQQLALLIGTCINPVLGNAFNPMPKEKWEALIAKAPEFFVQHNIPEIKYRNEKDARAANSMRIESFFLEGYRYGDLVKVEKGDIFLDCGAFIGDTALWAYHCGASQVYSFEPCAEILEDLKINLAANNHPVENVFPFALSNKNTIDKLNVWNTNNAGASLLRTESQHKALDDNKSYIQEIQCIRIDDWCAEHKVDPTFIKMDIEGAEIDAIEGGAETIKRLKPKMAVCLYHVMDHLWKIPCLLHQLVPEYKFYCRKNHFMYDVVLYATV